MLIKTCCRGLDIVVVKKDLRMAGVFTGDNVNAFEDFDCAKGYIFKITDGSRDNVEHFNE